MMSFDKIEQWITLLKDNKVLYQRIKVSLLLLTGIALSVLMYLTANLAILLYTNNNDINVRSINTAKADSRQVDTMTRSIERRVRDISRIFGEPDGNEKNLIALLSDKPNNLPGRYLITFLSDADSSAASRRMRVSKGSDLHDKISMKVIGKSDTQDGLTHTDLAAVKDGWQKGSWSKSEKAVIMNYQQKLYSTSGSGEKKLIGVVSARIAIEEFQKSLAYQNLSQYGYRFIVDGDGLTLEHPNKNLVINNLNLIDYAKHNYSAENSKSLQQAFKAKASVSIYDKNIINDQKTILRFEPVGSTGWYACVALLVDELAVPDGVLKQQLIQSLTALIALMLFSGLYFTFLSPSTEAFHKRLLLYSWFVSFTFIIGLFCIWELQITKGIDSPYDDNCITTPSQVEKYKKEQTGKAQSSLILPPQFIQTGVMVNSANVSEPNSTVDIYGTIWQRIPAGVEVNRVAGVYFPDQIETKMAEIYRIEENGFTVIGWNFCTRLQQDYRSTLYPFDRIDIKIRMRQPKNFESIVLVPDIASYKLISPSAKPMVPEDFSVPGWDLHHTYFNFSEQSFNIDYGRRALLGSHNLKDLVMKITLERDGRSGIVSVIVPIFLIMVILYSGVYMITNDSNTRESFNFAANEAIAIGSGFTIFLVVTIQSLRSQVIPLDIQYVEKIYFVIYVAMLANVILAIAVTKKSGLLFSYRHGILFRYLYWPVYSAIFFIITLFSFY